MKFIPIILMISMGPALAAMGPGGVDDGLRVWLRADSGISASDGDQILLWPEISGNGASAKYNPSNGYGELPPRYVASNPGANHKPTLRFNGQNALELNLDFLAGSDYTIFVVNARDRDGAANFYLAGEGAVKDTNLILGYEAPDRIRFSHFADDLDGPVAPYAGEPAWSIDMFRFSSQTGGEIYRDGSLVTLGGPFEPLVSNQGTTLGHFRAFGDHFWFVGDLAEVIVYDRALTSVEQGKIEAELSGYYSRTVNDRVLESTWATTVPTIDGNPIETDWATAETIKITQQTIEIGTVRFLNDEDHLYILFDLPGDMGDDDPPTFSEPGDSMALHIDVNENGLIDDRVDLIFAIANDGITPCRAELRGPYSTTGCFPTNLRISEQFGSSPWEAQVHRIIEVALPLSEMSANQGETLRMGFRLTSAVPSFRYHFPPELWADIQRMFGVELANPPPIFRDSFESQ